MQLMPATAKHYGVDPRDPAQNIEAGAAHLRELLLKYDGDAQRALAAYNAGPGAVHKYNGVPPYAETQTYVNRVLNKYKKAME
ncbi:MAG: lytic transglycosylase domain-containing protein, partial [Bryobacteraceae bacterium]